MKPQTQKVLSLLKSGTSLTQAGAMRSLRVKNLSARVSELRQAGFPIYANTTKRGTTSYRLGTPSRGMIAAAYAIAGDAIFR